MKALYYEKPLRENACICEKPYPVCGDDDVIIKIMSCSICHGVECDHEAEAAQNIHSSQDMSSRESSMRLGKMLKPAK